MAAAIRQSIEISRSPEDVFAYLDDPSRHGEWQSQIVKAEVQTPARPESGRESNRPCDSAGASRT